MAVVETDMCGVDANPPRMARVHASLPCADCGEAAMETPVRRLDRRELCQPRFDAALGGRQRVAPPPSGRTG
ncbi:MAG: hypothetical protein M3O23_00375 [Actinomycetota bacterium]|nr:hypothetical protein [Actinomycetota bacterium]